MIAPKYPMDVFITKIEDRFMHAALEFMRHDQKIRESRKAFYNPPDEPTLIHWITEFGPSEIESAIRTAGRREKAKYFDGRDGFIKYVSGILRKRREEESE